MSWGFSLSWLIAPNGKGARTRVRKSRASHPCLCISCLTVVFPGEVRPLSVSSAPEACPDVWVSRPALPGPPSSWGSLFPVNLGKGPISQVTGEAEHTQHCPPLHTHFQLRRVLGEVGVQLEEGYVLVHLVECFVQGRIQSALFGGGCL